MTSDRVEQTTPFIVMDIMEKAQSLERQGRNIVHFEVGEPDFAMPQVVAEAVIAAVNQGRTHYTASLGVAELREAVADYYRRTYGVTVASQRIIITSGTSGAFLLLFGALFQCRDQVLLADPGYPCYPNFARFVCAEPVPVAIDEEDGFQLSAERVKPLLNPAVKAVLVSSPANPTGAVTSQATYRWLLEHVPLLISDEIYHHLYYGSEPSFTALQLSDEAIVVDGFSKRYAMTGMRIGWMVVPERLVRPIQKLSQNLVISVATLSQYAALAAITQADAVVRDRVAQYRQRHDLLVAGLRDLGFGLTVEPQGAFYVYARTRDFATDSFAFCHQMLEQAGVAATPGIDFGRHRCEQYVRFAFTIAEERIREGLDRLRRWLRP